MPYDLHDHPGAVHDVFVHFAYGLRVRRREARIGQAVLSERAGLSQSTISLLENGLAENIAMAHLARVAAAFAMDLLIAPCPHRPGVSDLEGIGRVARDRSGTLARIKPLFPPIHRRQVADPPTILPARTVPRSAVGSEATTAPPSTSPRRRRAMTRTDEE